MSDLQTVSALVKGILSEDRSSRNSDNCLYLKVLEHYSTIRNTDIHTMTVLVFLKELDRHSFPGFETVRRSRQKVQATFPELAADGTVRRSRSRNEDNYRDFALGEV